MSVNSMINWTEASRIRPWVMQTDPNAPPGGGQDEGLRDARERRKAGLA